MVDRDGNIDSFWEDITLPYQERDGNFQFTNPVAVANKFAKASGLRAYLGKQAEVLTEQIANLTIKLEIEERKLKVLKREILSSHYKQFTKSSGSEVREAFIFKMAREDGVLPEILSIEAEIEELQTSISKRQPRVEKLVTRIKALNTNMEYAEQYLNFDKHVNRTGRF